MATAPASAKRRRRPKTAEPQVTTVAFPSLAEEHLDTSTLEQVKLEKSMVEAAAGAPISGCRIHYLKVVDSTFSNLAQAEFKYDSSLMFDRKDVDPKEKSFISESTNNLKIQADRFNNRLKNFEELGKNETASVKTLAVYDELAYEAQQSLLK